MKGMYIVAAALAAMSALAAYVVVVGDTTSPAVMTNLAITCGVTALLVVGLVRYHQKEEAKR